MPYHWSSTSPETTAETAGSFETRATAPLQLTLTAHNSLTPKGFVWFIGVTAVLMLIPLGALIGLASLWVILGFLGLALGSVWVALKSNWKRGEIHETLNMWSDHVILVQTKPDGSTMEWAANPYWVKVLQYEKEGPVPAYLTLQSKEKEVELGSFLSEDERIDLYKELIPIFSALRRKRP